VFPIIELNVLLALFSSLWRFWRRLMATRWTPRSAIRSRFNALLAHTSVGSLPQVKTWRGHLATVSPSGNSNGVLPAPGDSASRGLSTYEEAIRTLRNSILLMDFDRRFARCWLPGIASEGKSTIAISPAVRSRANNTGGPVIDGTCVVQAFTSASACQYFGLVESVNDYPGAKRY